MNSRDRVPEGKPQAIPGSHKFDDPLTRRQYETGYDQANQRLADVLANLYSASGLGKTPPSILEAVSVISQSYADSLIQKQLADAERRRLAREQAEAQELRELDERIKPHERQAVKEMAAVILDTTSEIISRNGWSLEPFGRNLSARILHNSDIQRARETGLLLGTNNRTSRRRETPPFSLYFGDLDDLIDPEELAAGSGEYGYHRRPTVELAQAVHGFTLEFVRRAGFARSYLLSDSENYKAVTGDLSGSLSREIAVHAITGLLLENNEGDWVSPHTNLPFTAYAHSSVVHTRDGKDYLTNNQLRIHYTPRIPTTS